MPGVVMVAQAKRIEAIASFMAGCGGDDVSAFTELAEKKGQDEMRSMRMRSVLLISR